MKVLILNGSPHENGNTAAVLREMVKIFEAEGIETETVVLGNQLIRGCTGCGACYKIKKCAFDDIVNDLALKFEEADGMIVASPVYYASANSTLTACLDRLFYSTRFDKRMKVGASVAVARRGGISSTFDQLNKYFTISEMPLASSCYWNGIHGAVPGEAEQDAEGMRVARTLAKNMVFLMRSVALGIKAYGLPEREPKAFTNFIR